jgi:hypothetical protein
LFSGIIPLRITTPDNPVFHARLLPGAANRPEHPLRAKEVFSEVSIIDSVESVLSSVLSAIQKGFYLDPRFLGRKT